jgi:hypothetical protein
LTIFIPANNSIKLINGETFDNLYNIKQILFLGNSCFSQNFLVKSDLQKLPKIASDHCGFCEPAVEISNCEMMKDFKRTGKRVFDLLKHQEDETEQIKFEIAGLKKVLADLLKRDGVSETTLNDKLNYELKFNENEKLKEDLRKALAENEAKDREIEELKGSYSIEP